MNSEIEVIPRRTAEGHFQRLNALVNNGWLSVLKPIELQLWLVLEKHAAKDGTAYPDGSTIARLIGHEQGNHVSRARRQLKNYGLIEVLEPGGGRGRSTVVRVTIPPPAPAYSKHLKTGNVSIAETVPDRIGKPPEVADKPSRIEREHNKEEQHKEHPKELPSKTGRRGKNFNDSWTAEAPVPESLQTPEFMADWATFQTHRVEKKNKLTPTAARLQLAKLAEMGPERATAALRHSVANGWTGVFEPNERSNANGQPNRTRGTDEQLKFQ